MLSLIHLACRNSNLKLVNFLFGSGRIDLRSNGQSYLNLVCEPGYLEFVEFLFRDPRINPSINEIIITASYEGHIEIVKLLLEYPRVDPKARNNQAIKYVF